MILLSSIFLENEIRKIIIPKSHFMKRVILFFLLFAPLWTSAQEEKSVLVTTGLELLETRGTERLIVHHLIPDDLEGRQKIKRIKIAPEPKRIINMNGARYAEFDLLPDTLISKRIEIKTILILYPRDLKTIREKRDGTLVDSIALEQYLRAEHNIVKDDPYIVEVASKLKGNSTIKTAENVYNYVRFNIDYFMYGPSNLSARYVLKQGKGNFADFSISFVTLCRSLSIPARVVYGYSSYWAETPKHQWAEFYDEELGWIPVEPTEDSGKKFNILDNKYIYMSHIYQDKLLKGAFPYYYRYQGKAPVVKEFSDVKRVTIDWSF